MNKLFFAIVLIAALVVGWFVLTSSNDTDYVANLDTEVAALEAELVSLEAAVSAGTMSETEATDAKIRIINRLNAINDAANQSEKQTLTTAQRAQLQNGLNRLKRILINYQATLTVVDQNANEAQVTSQVRRGGAYRTDKPLAVVAADIIENVEESVVDSVQDYEPDASLDAEIEAVVAEAAAAAEVEVEAEVEVNDSDTTQLDDTSSSTEDSATESGEAEVAQTNATTSDDGADDNVPAVEDESLLEAEVETEAELQNN